MWPGTLQVKRSRFRVICLGYFQFNYFILFPFKNCILVFTDYTCTFFLYKLFHITDYTF